MTVTATPPPSGVTGKISNYLDERTSVSGAVKEFGRKIFPDHWSFLLGEVALYSFVIILLSGSFLTFFFQASMAIVEYEGSYVPLKGIEMSVAMASTLDISGADPLQLPATAAAAASGVLPMTIAEEFTYGLDLMLAGIDRVEDHQRSPRRRTAKR
jgi:hypothetical protein